VHSFVDDDVPITWEDEVFNSYNFLIPRVPGAVMSCDWRAGAESEALRLLGRWHPDVKLIDGSHLWAYQLANHRV
jgi:hypothetical protein